MTKRLSRQLTLIIGTTFVPSIGWAATSTQRDFQSIAGVVTDFLMNLVPLLASIALLMFFWGLVEYVFQSGDEGAVEAGKNRLVVGLLGLFTIAAVWGLMQLIGNTFKIF